MFGGDIHAHAFESLADLRGAGGAIGEASVGASFLLESQDEFGCAEEGAFFMVDGSVEVEEDGVKL